jgi:hypothetical protein
MIQIVKNAINHLCTRFCGFVQVKIFDDKEKEGEYPYGKYKDNGQRERLYTSEMTHGQTLQTSGKEEFDAEDEEWFQAKAVNSENKHFYDPKFSRP